MRNKTKKILLNQRGQDNPVRLIFTGDLYVKKLPRVSKKLIDYFMDVDLVVANLEGPILSGQKTQQISKAGPVLAQAKMVPSMLNALGINVVACANNHIFDYGSKGLKSTLKVLKANGIKHIGAGNNEKVAGEMLKIDGTKLKLVNAAEDEFGVVSSKEAGYYSLYSDDLNKRIKSESDKGFGVIAIIHGGGEMAPLPSKYFIDRARDLINAGAILVVGHHSHVPFGYEKHKKGYIYYGLGNFCHTSHKKSTGLLLDVKISGRKIKSIVLKKVLYGNNKLELGNVDSDLRRVLTISNKIIDNNELTELFLNKQSVDMFEDHYHKYFKQIFSKKGNKFFQTDKRFVDSSKDALLLMNLLVNKTHTEFILRGLKEKYYMRTSKFPKDMVTKYKFLKNYIKEKVVRA